MLRISVSLLVLSTVAFAGIKKVDYRGEHFLVLRDDGSVIGFGPCQRGQLALPNCEHRPNPIPIALARTAKDIAVQQTNSYAVLDDGSVWGWGEEAGGPSPVRIAGLPQAARIWASNSAVAVLTEAGEVWMWGYIGRQAHQKTPVRIEGLPPILSMAIDLHFLAVGRDGSLWAWGLNRHGQMGDGTRQNSAEPRKIQIPPVVSAGAGHNNSVAVLADGTVRVWGRNDSATMGNGQNVQDEGTVVPTPVAGVTGAASVSAGTGHIIVLLKNGTMRTWGHDGWGQAGIGTIGGYQMRPAAPKLTGVTAVFTPMSECFATTSDGRLWFWGMGRYRLQGVMREDKKVPTEIAPPW